MANTLQAQAINNLLIQKLSEIINNWLAIPKTNGWVFGKVKWADVVSFITKSLDDLIQFAESVFKDGSGTDKKAMVLNAIGVVYDMISADFLPIFLKPFSTSIKSFLIDVVISNAIDFLVKKYNNGGWNKEVIDGPLPQI